MKIKQLISYPNPNELGLGNTNETYIRVENNLDVSDIFPPLQEVEVVDCMSHKTYSLKAKDGNEFRINQLGQLYRDYKVCPGDEIKFTQIDNGKKSVLFTVTNHNRVFLSVTSKGTEIVNIERLVPFANAGKDKEFVIKINEGTLKLTYDKSERKRSDSPAETDFYKTTVNDIAIEKGSYYITIKDGKNIIEEVVKNRVEEYIIDESNDTITTPNDILVLPLQRILYGAPGTGKSFSIKNVIKEHNGKELDMEDEHIFRTTFHPDYDYAQFVGCYKPKKDDDGKITYDFAPQVFTNALIKAYENLCERCPSGTQRLGLPTNLTFNCKGAKYTINAVSDRNITTTKEYCIKKSAVQSTWNILWDTGSYVVKIGPQSGRSTQIAVCNWINSNYNSPAANNFDDGWTYLVEALDAGPIIADSVFQKYQVSKVDSETLHITSQGNNAKSTLQGCYNGSSKCEGIQVGIIDILKKYNEDSFENAWEKLSQNVNSSYSEESEEDINIEQNVDSVSETQSTAPVYLVIEEINRGNCAQIFGDIFQLLDRNSETGVSEYAINVDEDLRKYLEDQKIDGLINDGKIKLPSNFNIIATMNTSDQSLFPMDSAFKRRWEWEYVPIKYQNKDDSGAVVTYWIDGKYNWNIVQKIINLKILDITKSEDKQLGDYFIKGVKNNEGLYVIDTDKFINKVMFYLWNDICKDNYNTDDNFFRKETKDKEGEYEEFSFGQLAADDSILDSFILYLKVLAEENKKEWEHLLKDGEINNLEKNKL